MCIKNEIIKRIEIERSTLRIIEEKGNKEKLIRWKTGKENKKREGGGRHSK